MTHRPPPWPVPADRAAADQVPRSVPRAFLPEIDTLIAIAASEINAHANDKGNCAACRAPSPCERVQLAEFTLGAACRASWRKFPGTASQVRAARLFAEGLLESYPASDDVILCVSELATNAVRHSTSGSLGGTFAVGIETIQNTAVVLRVRDQGGPWQQPADDDERLHGLGIVRSLAAGVRVDGNPATGWMVTAWFDLDGVNAASQEPTQAPGSGSAQCPSGS